MNTNTLMEIVKNEVGLGGSLIKGVVTIIFSTVFLKEKKNEEFEKIRAGHFNEVIGFLLDNGKMSYYEYYKAKNFLSIAQLADKYYLENKAKKKENDYEKNVYDFDWFIRFFNNAGEISNEEVKQYLAKIFAGEVEKPGTFSFRTLEILHNLSREDLKIFEVAATLSMSDMDDDIVIFCTDDTNELRDINAEYGFGRDALIELEEIGLLNGTRFQSSIRATKPYGFVSGEYYLNLEVKDESKEIYISMCPFTKAGKQLISLFETPRKEEYIFEIGRCLKSMLNEVAEVQIYKVVSNNREEVEIDDSIDYLDDIGKIYKQ